MSRRLTKWYIDRDAWDYNRPVLALFKVLRGADEAGRYLVRDPRTKLERLIHGERLADTADAAIANEIRREKQRHALEIARLESLTVPVEHL